MGKVCEVSLIQTCFASRSLPPSPAPMTEVAPLSPDEIKAELARLTELAGVDLRPEVFEVLSS